ncbi:MAG: PDZ domain-containing protein, partial [Myxococcota bacterium]|nr:PDZ domain-containing protein [Myxococcota bacterium]
PATTATEPSTSVYSLPSSIPVMEASVSGPGGQADIDLIADTGSGVTLLLESVFDAIDDGSLLRLEGYIWGTNYGFDDGFLTRIPTLSAGDGAAADVAYSWAVVIPDDNHLWALLEGNGIFADGFLGYPFYRRFVVGVDGHEDRYLWWPYEGDDHVDPQEWTRIGVEPTWRDGGFTVEMLYRPSDAEDQGIEVGDRITAIDGTDLTGSTLDDLKHLLRGDVGDTRVLDLQRGDLDIQFTVSIDDLLPRP